MHTLYLLSVWLHILAAVTWLGGMIFLVLVVAPVLRQAEYRHVAGKMLHQAGVRFRWVGWICFGILILTGTFNLVYRGFTWEDFWNWRLWVGPWRHTLATKLLLVAFILLLSALHDFLIGPRATRLWQQHPDAPEVKRLRRHAAWIGRVNLLLALAVVALGVMLVRGIP